MDLMDLDPQIQLQFVNTGDTDAFLTGEKFTIVFSRLLSPFATEMALSREHLPQGTAKKYHRDNTGVLGDIPIGD